MQIKINKNVLKGSAETPLFIIDIIMMVLILTNLSWLVFDSIFAIDFFRENLHRVLPRFTDYYGAAIHPNFYQYDLVFVGIFITELTIRWLIAIRRKTYYRWWFYPFIHWYDVLGCIPVGAFRWLRLLRVFSIAYRLERYNIIDVTGTAPVRFVLKYANVLMEEISNRVVVNVISSLQDEINAGTPVVNNIIDQVIRPRIPELTDWLMQRADGLPEAVFEARKEALRGYIKEMVEETFAQNSGVAELKRVPVIGNHVAQVVEQGVSELIYDLAEHIAGDVAEVDTNLMITELTDALSHKLGQMPPKVRVAGREMAIEAMEVVKDEARVQKWKLADQQARMERARVFTL